MSLAPLGCDRIREAADGIEKPHLSSQTDGANEQIQSDEQTKDFTIGYIWSGLTLVGVELGFADSGTRTESR